MTPPPPPPPLQELSRLDDSANVFKLIGPALIKQARARRSARDSPCAPALPPATPPRCGALVPHGTHPGPPAAQDLTEARANVSKRLDYIKGEMGRVDAQIKGLQEKGAARQQEVMKLQKRLAGAAGGS